MMGEENAIVKPVLFSHLGAFFVRERPRIFLTQVPLLFKLKGIFRLPGAKRTPLLMLFLVRHTQALIFQPCHTCELRFNGTSCVIVVVIKAPRCGKICAASEEKNCLLTKKISSHHTPGELRSARLNLSYLESREQHSLLLRTLGLREIEIIKQALFYMCTFHILRCVAQAAAHRFSASKALEQRSLENLHIHHAKRT